jgi:hypothetical protein
MDAGKVYNPLRRSGRKEEGAGASSGKKITRLMLMAA